jgi:hypothetical protein
LLRFAQFRGALRSKDMTPSTGLSDWEVSPSSRSVSSDTPDDELLDQDAVCRFFGGTKPIHPATLWRGVKSGRYSKPIKVAANTNRWRRHELQSDLDRMAAERDGAPA